MSLVTKIFLRKRYKRIEELSAKISECNLQKEVNDVTGIRWFSMWIQLCRLICYTNTVIPRQQQKSEKEMAAAAKSLQSCPTLCDPIDGSPPGSPIPGILQARTLEWVVISFSNAWKWKGKVKSLSRVRLLATPWTAAHQAPRSMGFSRQEYWSGVPFLPRESCGQRSLGGLLSIGLHRVEHNWSDLAAAQQQKYVT